jgi:uncharacterized protein YbjT (DUF2867 family)
MKPIAFIAGATGYTGRALTQQWAEQGLQAVAHVRPDSPRRDAWTQQFQQWGATVDTTPWEQETFTQRLKQLQPTHVFALLGTTAKRSAKERREGTQHTGYEGVDYGLTVLLLRAAAQLPSPPRFVYLSSLGVNKISANAYLNARFRVESELKAGNMPYTIVRPAIISGPNREEFRPLERAASVISDTVFSGLSAIGLTRARDQWGSITNQELAKAMCKMALDPEAKDTTVSAGEIAASLRER